MKILIDLKLMIETTKALNTFEFEEKQLKNILNLPT